MPLTSLMSGDGKMPVTLNEEEIKAFEGLKRVLTEDLMVMQPDPKADNSW